MKFSEAQKRAELARRKQARKLPWDPHAILYEDQRRVFDDPERDRVLEGTRQLGKSTLAAVIMLQSGIDNPGSDNAYVDLDIEHADKVIARDYEALIEKYNIPGNPRLIDGDVYFDNGAVLYSFSGRPSELEKLQGLKLAMLIIDEAQDAKDLEGIVKMCRPALMRFRGRILFAGIPGRIRGIGFWWDITRGSKAHLYGQHRGHYRRNPYLDPVAVDEQFAKAKEELGADNPDFIRHWLGEWPEADNALRVYRYDPEKHGFTDLPVCDVYISGTDPAGVRDREATVVLGFRNDSDKIWAVAENVSKKGAGGEYWDTAEVLRKLSKQFYPLRSFYDFGSAAKSMLVTTITRDYSHMLEAVPPKSLDFEIPRINSALQQSRLLVSKEHTPELAADLAGVYWDSDARSRGQNKYDKKTPHPDVADAMRAAMWGVPGYEAEARERKKPKTEEEMVREEIDKMYEKSGQLFVKKEGALDKILGRREPLRRDTRVQRRY